jgi:hypothetical protein
MLAIMPLILSLAPEIARWIGGNQAAGVTTAVADAVRSIAGTDNPEDAAKALAADPTKAAELRVQLAKIAADAETAQRASELESLKVTLSANAAQQQADLEALRASIGDIGSARQQTVELAKAGSSMAWSAPIISMIILLAFAFMLYFVLEVGVKAESLALGNVLLGTLAAMATQVANYWLGSSSGSSRKDAYLQNAQAQLSRSVPAGMFPRPSALIPASAIPDGDEAIDAMSRASGLGRRG